MIGWYFSVSVFQNKWSFSGFEDLDYLPEIPINEVAETNIDEDDDLYSDQDGDDLYSDEYDEYYGEDKIGVKIVGGKESVPNKYPFAAVLTTKSGGHFCGGTLITRRHVVTAAHCFQAKPK